MLSSRIAVASRSCATTTVPRRFAAVTARIPSVTGYCNNGDDNDNQRRREERPSFARQQNAAQLFPCCHMAFTSLPNGRNFTVVAAASTTTTSRRSFSTNPNSLGDGESDTSTTTIDGMANHTNYASVDDTLNQLFAESSAGTASDAAAASAASVSSDAWYAATEHIVTCTAWSPTWYNVADQAVVAVTTMHDLSGLGYGWSIVATTVALRLALFPVLVQAQQAASRMAHVQPELQQLKVRYEKLGSPSRAEQLQFSANMKALFAKYNVNPLKTIVAPLVQLPLFIGMFFGLKKMPGIYPEALSDGGMFWFVDLTVPDPLYILPLVSAVTFMGLIEVGKEQMLLSSPGPQGQFLLNFFRAMAVASLPFCASFEAAMLCYWATNNTITMGQTLVLKSPPVRKYFGIWDPPKPVPGSEPQNLMTSVTNLVKKVQGEAVTDEQKIKKHNQEVEAKQTSFRLTRAAKERRRRQGITGTRNT